MTEIKLSEKFIAYIDILGYSALTKAAESGNGLSLTELDEIVKSLGTSEDQEHLNKYGPTTCPEAPKLQRNLDFQIAQAWDSVVISSEISPAGIANLISYCFSVSIRLLTKGVMCRGYVKRGMVYQKGLQILGSGHVDAVAKEKGVSFFKRDADERGTPFIEVDSEVVEYVAAQPDQCVRKLFDRMVLSHEGLSAIFPFRQLMHSFIIGGLGLPPFDAEKEKKSNDNLRTGLKNLQIKVMRFVDQSDASVVRKANHYVEALHRQLAMCDRTDEMIDALCKPFGGKFTREEFPRLFR